jgi:hypothetical protein
MGSERRLKLPESGAITGISLHKLRGRSPVTM